MNSGALLVIILELGGTFGYSFLVGLAKSGQEKIEIEITPNISFDWPKELCRRTVDVGTDEERVPEAGAVPEPQKIITSHHFILGGPHPRRGRTHKNNAGAPPPRFWVAPPRKGVGPARMRRREALI